MKHSLFLLTSFLWNHIAIGGTIDPLRQPGPFENLDESIIKAILDHLSPEEAIKMGKTSKMFHPALKYRFEKSMELAKDEPDCVFGSLAVTKEPDINFFKETFKFYYIIESKKWIADKMNETCQRREGKTPLELMWETDNGHFFKYAADMGAFVGTQ
jgi:hypothetical protein